MNINKRTKNLSGLLITAILVISSFSYMHITTTVGTPGENQAVELESHQYTTEHMIEQIGLYPLKNTSIGVEADFLGGSVELPFDITSYDNLRIFQLVLSKQEDWKDYSPRRFWDYPDGVSLYLEFRGIGSEEAETKGEEIAEMIKEAYGVTLVLVSGSWQNNLQITRLFFQGIMTLSEETNFIENFCSYLSKDGFGPAITPSIFLNAPIMNLGIGLYNVRFPIFGGNIEWVPILSSSWIDPEGLVKIDQTEFEMTVSNLLPEFASTPIEGS
jgi:hypothetical protein